MPDASLKSSELTAAALRIPRVRRDYNQWVADQTLEDYALRFTAESGRKWSARRVANTALGSISFLALEAIGAAITLSVGFVNAAWAIGVVGVAIFLAGLPISYYAARDGVDIDLLTRGAGFGYIGSTVTSLIYASFTFIFFAIEASIMAQALDLCFGVPPSIGYVISALVVIPLVTHGITFISRFQLWTQPLWVVLNLLPFVFIAASNVQPLHEWTAFRGVSGVEPAHFNLLAFGAAASVVSALFAQTGEQVDFLRFLPPKARIGRVNWWASLLCAGPGWIMLGALKMLAGSFLAVLVLDQGLSPAHATEPAHLYLAAFGYAIPSQSAALVVTGLFVVVAQLKINVTNAYAGSLAWSNFFSRLTHSHPGRVVWLVFNVAIALLLMELDIYRALERILGLYATIALAWVGAIVADLVVNKPLGLSPPHIEFKRAYLYDVNPVGLGAMLIGSTAAILAFSGLLGAELRALAPFLALGVAFVVAPAIAVATRGRYYLARADAPGEDIDRLCCICNLHFEHADMVFCPAYAGAICSLCCTLDARCGDRCKTDAQFAQQVFGMLGKVLPLTLVRNLDSRLGRFAAVYALHAVVIGLTLSLIYFQQTFHPGAAPPAIGAMIWMVFFVFMMIAGVVSWLLVLANESRRVAQEESQQQTALLMLEIEAHKRTDAMLQKAKEAAEAANHAKSRYLLGISHELRTPLNTIFGYVQLLEGDPAIPRHRRDAIATMRRSSQHLSGLIEGLLDISKIEAGRMRLNVEDVRIRDLLDQIVDMFRVQAASRAIAFHYEITERLPPVARADARCLRQILINLLSNAIKFTREGAVTLRVVYRGQVAEIEVEDTGVGILPEDLERVFEPFERGRQRAVLASPGTGLGLTITKLLTEVMGGEITITSTPGRGTLARIRLLLARVDTPRAEPPDARRIQGYQGPRRTVIVADDAADHRELVHAILAPLGFVVFTAPDGPTCLALASQCDPDIALLDVSMPGMDGWEVARRLRHSPGRRCAILMVSANASEFRRRRDEQEDYDDTLAKPFEIPQLLDRLEGLLGLEWDEEAPERPAPPAGADPSVAARRLPAETIEELVWLGRIGHLHGIEAKLREVEQADPAAGALAEELRGMARQFDFRRYLSALEKVDRADA